MKLFEALNLISLLLCKLAENVMAWQYLQTYDRIYDRNFLDHATLTRKKRGNDHERIKRETDSNEKCKKSQVDSAFICDPTTGGVCKNGTCVSSCSIKQMKKCTCPDHDDNYCYLCCGSSSKTCRPAHEYDIYQPNGEMWERTSCSGCRNRATDGLSCDDRDLKRMCHNSKCASNVCLQRPEGSYCDARKMKICTDLQCMDPCGSIKPELLTCECDIYSDSRCELCCYDPYTKRCENAFKKYGVRSVDKRPIRRNGISCRYGPNCNFYGVCSGKSSPFHRVLTLIGFALFVRQIFVWRF